jgi:hypothetical protein
MLAPRGVSPSFQEFSIGSSNFEAWRSVFIEKAFGNHIETLARYPKLAAGTRRNEKASGIWI